MSKAGYPIWWETTITLFNKFEDKQTNVVTWYKTVITDCFWKMTGTQVTIGDTVLDSKSLICRIPKDTRFKEYQDWIKTPNDQMADYFTLSQGDIIVRGEIDDVIDEYTQGQRSSDLLGKYQKGQGCFVVSSYSINVGMGRNNEHYLAQGK